MSALTALSRAGVRWSVTVWRRPASPWGAALLAWALGVGLAWLCALLWWGPGWTEAWLAHGPVVPKVVDEPVAPVPAPEASAGQSAATLTPAPEVGERDAAWFWFQQRLQAHGLRLLALRPEPWQNGPLLAQQAAHLRLQGAWADWLAWGRALSTHAPWWTWEQWQVQAADGPGQVLVDARLRLWLRPEGGPAMAERGWPNWPLTANPRTTALLFAQADAATPAPAASAPTLAAQTPAWRLWGVWTQAGHSRAVLGRGNDWTVLAPGQSLGPQGLRLEGIGDHGVRLSAPGSAQGRWLTLEDAP